jgi:hypothetical protein
MKLPVIRKIRKEDLGGEAPAWIDRLLSPLNQFIEQVGVAITGRLTIGDNISGRIISQEFEHNVELEIGLSDNRLVLGIVPLFADGFLISAYGWEKKDNGNIGITVQFSAGSGETDCKILVLFS